MSPIASPRLWLNAAVKVSAISGRLVGMARGISPPSAWPRPSRDESTSVVSERWIPATQIAPAATRKSRISQGSPSEPNTPKTSTFRPHRLGTLLLVFSPSVDNLVAQLTRLPGVGQRTAQRLAFHL